jgi:hypothetical protein
MTIISLINSAHCALDERDYLHAASLFQGVVNELEGEELGEDEYTRRRIAYLIERDMPYGSGKDTIENLPYLQNLKEEFDRQYNAAIRAVYDAPRD